ncbi:MAG: AMP-binding protein [Tannerellaceae bacterium]
MEKRPTIITPTALTAAFRNELETFLTEWTDTSETVTVHTSGSTGTPKPYTVRKEQMRQSALQTAAYLNLRAGEAALLCMPLRYIAGKMMVVRALVSGLRLVVVSPGGRPLKEMDEWIDLAAMIPLQVYNSLRVPEERRRLARIRRLIIGGGAIDATLEAEIRTLPNPVYSTYGMTETLSHIALRRLNGPDASAAYTPLPSVRLSLTPDDALVIDAPMVCSERLVTNDIARLLPDGSFIILGRKDNTINTGGIKVQAETVEAILRPYITTPFAITARPDARLGESVVLLVEAPVDTTSLSVLLTHLFPGYDRPKQIVTVSSLPLTGNGKIDRATCRRIVTE